MMYCDIFHSWRELEHEKITANAADKIIKIV